MDVDTRQKIADSLVESYKPRYMDDMACAICHASDRKLSTGIIRYTQYKNQYDLPDGFVCGAASNIGGYHVTGYFPVCDQCAPVCKKCGLPIFTKAVTDFYCSLQKTYNNKNDGKFLSVGHGICGHVHLLFDIKELFLSKIKNLFKI